MREQRNRGGIGKTAPAQGGTTTVTKTSAPAWGAKAVPGVARLPYEIHRHVWYIKVYHMLQGQGCN